MNSRLETASLVVFVIAASTFGTSAQDAKPDFADTTLTGDWGGRRTALYEKGLDLEVVYSAGVVGNLAGGRKNGTAFVDNLDVIVTVDNEKLLGIKGNSFRLYFLNNNGGEPNGGYAGTLQGIDNIEVATHTAKIYEAWVQQNFWNDRLSLLAGLYDLNSEFYANDAAGLFLGSTFGIGNEFAATGRNGPSIFPTTTVGLRLQARPIESVYVLAAVLDGVPGDPGDPRGTQITFEHGDGALLVAEIGVTPKSAKGRSAGKYALGLWRYTDGTDDVRDVDANGDPRKRHSQGLYVLIERPLHRVNDTDDRGLAGFVRFGFTDGNTTAFDYSWSAGLVYTGLIPTRDAGKLGFGISQAGVGEKFRDASAAAGMPLDRTETGFEITYLDEVYPGVTVQPNIQYFINPGADPSQDDAFIIGLRLALSL